MKKWFFGVMLVIAMPPAYAQNNSTTNQNAVNLNKLPAKWWQYVLSIRTPENPATDPTGANCGVGQHGPVWFLGGSIGAGAAVTRNCTLPADKQIFFPVVNAINIGGLCNQDISETINEAENLTVTLDGKPIRKIRRITSNPFTVVLPTANISSLVCNDESGLPMDLPDGVYVSSVDDGYYVLLPNIPAGLHTLRIAGDASDEAGGRQGITYSLNVVSE